jgi:hypothetical protein
MTQPVEVTLGPICGEGLGPFGKWACNLQGGATGAVEAFKNLASAISNIVGALTIIAGLFFIFQFIIAGFGWITSGGDKTALSAAQQKITSSLIGLVVVVAAIALIDIIGRFLGLKILLDPEELVKQLNPVKPGP